MADPVATYSFLPWLKGGLAKQISAADGANVPVRATIDVGVVIGTDNAAISLADRTVTTKIQLVGPGDIRGVNITDVIVKTNPREWVTNFEPNYLPFIEFYDEDFPWRYTPAAADTGLHRVRPWLTLVVLEGTEFEELRAANGPLPTIRVANAATCFPPPSQLWAWAHVHVNEDLTADHTRDVAASTTAFEQLVSAHPDRAYSRLLCPRKLKPETDYYAFVIPTFESGRLTGLGLPIPPALKATQNAWGVNNAITDYPVYHRWYFRTGITGDFEYLVRLLEAKPMDARVGIREMDARNPGTAITGIADDIRLEGALRCPPPGAQSSAWPVPRPQPFQTTLQVLLNAPAQYQLANPTGDPIVAPPIYGARHALINELTTGTVNWVHDLNLDPRLRVPAAFGTEVIQENQERYMSEAWRQVGDVLAANQKIRHFQVGVTASVKYHQDTLATVAPATALALTAPVHGRILITEASVVKTPNASATKQATLASQLVPTVLPGTVFAPSFRRAFRPGSTIFRRVKQTGPSIRAWIERINSGDITATPPKVTPPEILTETEVSDGIQPTGIPFWLQPLLRNWVIFFLLLLLLIVLVLLLFGLSPLGIGLAVAIVVVGIALWRRWLTFRHDEAGANAVDNTGWTPGAVLEIPPAPGFVIAEPSASSAPPSSPPSGSPAGSDSSDAADYRAALIDLYGVFATIPETPPPRPEVKLETVATRVLEAVDPTLTQPKRLDRIVKLSPDLRRQWRGLPLTVLAYPEFTEPMYKPLSDKSSELLLPNIHLITPNTVSLLVPNQRFIEAYMVGLNHEMMRELLWREYPTDLQGTPFRQFWDVSGFVNTDTTLTEEALREKLKDIGPLHDWRSNSQLGQHNQRDASNSTPQLVLVIRGELLKRYPNTVVYAHRAKWKRHANNSINRDLPRLLDDAANAEKYPLYGAKVAPDIHFIGFDLELDEARGGSGANPTDGAGWFFVLKERPGEPRFGLDLAQPAPAPLPALTEWDDVTWDHVALQNDHISVTSTLSLVPPPAGQNNNPENAVWSANTNSADLAHILYQDPVMVAVHAAEMLRGA